MSAIEGSVSFGAGNSGLSWSDVLLGDMPNVYVYAANNPSESILAKRRGYGTIISHNVPPYARSVPPTSALLCFVASDCCHAHFSCLHSQTQPSNHWALCDDAVAAVLLMRMRA